MVHLSKKFNFRGIDEISATKLTDFGERRDEYPERDDEGNFHSLELDMEDVVLMALVLVHGAVVTEAVGGVCALHLKKEDVIV